MNHRTARASGKIIVAGEHAVVYGVPGVVAGIDRGAQAVGWDAEAFELHLSGMVIRPNAAGSDLERAFHALCEAAPVAHCARVNASSELQKGGGLGSSAALGVAIARAIDGREERVYARGLAWERIFHGNPSGIDTAASQSGALMRFVKDKPAQPLHTDRDLWFSVGFSGNGSSTRLMVEKVAALQPSDRADFLRGVDDVVTRVQAAVAESDAELLGLGLNENQRLLAQIGLSTPNIDKMVELATASGALGAKLTGSGGGGCVIAFGGFGAPGDGKSDAAILQCERTLEAWRGKQFSGFVTCVSRTKLSGVAN